MVERPQPLKAPRSRITASLAVFFVAVFFKAQFGHASQLDDMERSLAISQPQFKDLAAYGADMVFFITNRKANPAALAGAHAEVAEFDDYFLNAQSPTLVLGEVCVTHPLNRQIAEQNFNDIPEPDNPVKYFALERPNSEPGKDSLKIALRNVETSKYYADCIAHNKINLNDDLSHSTNDRPTIYIHGWNTSFKSAITRAAQIALDLSRGPILVVTWPSDISGDINLTPMHQIGAYRKAESVEKTAIVLVPLAIDLAESASGKSLAVVAHSMGARLYVNALHAMHATRSKILINIDVAVLAAPDVAKSDFENMLNEIPIFTDNFTIYCAADVALLFSEALHGQTPLGECKSKKPDGPSPQQMVRVSGKMSDPFRHSYFLSARELIDDISNVFKLADSHPGPSRSTFYQMRSIELK